MIELCEPFNFIILNDWVPGDIKGELTLQEGYLLQIYVAFHSSV